MHARHRSVRRSLPPAFPATGCAQTLLYLPGWQQGFYLQPLISLHIKTHPAEHGTDSQPVGFTVRPGKNPPFKARTQLG